MAKKKKTDIKPVLVVGIGASAGGLDALKKFFKAMPKNSGLAFIVVQHLDPDHKSMMAEILSRDTELTIQEATSNQKIKANCAYIIPPNTYIEVIDHTVKLSKPRQKRGHRMAVDYLFRSMADVYQAQAIGIIFSGTGSDGTAGLRALKAAGGLTIVQDPKTAEHSGMPRSAIDAGVVDRVLNVEDIPAVIRDYAAHPYVEFEEEVKDQAEEDLRTIGALLSAQENMKLDQYKEGTVHRRVCRRMSLTGKENRSDYIKLLRKDKKERQCLMQDLLINVTDFFRDKKAYKVLEDKVVADIINNAENGSEIRIWVAGCASGEEAYSLAMLFMDKIEDSGRDLDLNMFATDVDEEAIKTARKGIYPVSIVSELPETYLDRYFTSLDEDYYKVMTSLRDKISFASQNIYSDPPFSKMDLISCRNVLIYLRRPVQVKVLKSFYFALKPEGYLFLGTSENIGEQKKLFKPVSSKWRIYRRLDYTEEKESEIPTPTFFQSRDIKSIQRRNRPDKPATPSDQAREALLQCVGPSVLINGENRIIYLHGDLKDFLNLPEGEPQLNLMKMLDGALRTRLRSGIFKVRRSREKVIVHSPKSSDKPNAKPTFQASICLAGHKNLDEDAVIITFETLPAEDAEPKVKKSNVLSVDQDKMVEIMERELIETKEELQNTVEELETSTEELKASHEEALSTNEELQSSNEELEASTEELRSLNEELTTVNAQLKDKIEQLQAAHDDLENFFASTNLATIFLSSKLKIKRYTPAAERLLRMGPQDIDRDISDISRPLIEEDTLDSAKHVLESLEGSEKEIKTEKGEWFVRKILPYRTEDQRIAGVVITFNNITALKHATRNVEKRETQHAVVAKLGLEALKGDSIEDLLDHLVREVTHTLDAHYCKVLEYQPEKNKLFLRAGIGWKPGLVGKAYLPADSGSQGGYTLKEHEPVIVKELQKEKRFRGPKLLEDHKVTSGISCIIENGDHPYGVLGVHSRNKRDFTRDDANFLMSVANLLSIALHRKRAEESLKRSQERLNMAREAAQIGIHDYDLLTNTIRWDSKVREIWGIPKDLEPITYEVFDEGLHPDDREPTRKAVEDAINKKNNGNLRIEYRVINKKDGSLRWIEATGKAFFQDGKAIRLVGTVQDITFGKKAQQELFESEQRLRIAKDSNDLGAFEYDMQSGNLKWDDILKDIWGFNSDFNPHMDDFFKGLHADDQESTKKAIEKAADPKGDGHYHSTYRVINKKTKQQSWVEASGQVLFENDKPVKMIGMIIDITEQKRLQQSLQEAVAQLEAADKKKNEFLATLGHELRNPLAAINGGVQMMQIDMGEAKWALDMVAKNVKQIASLLDDLLDLTRISRGKIHFKKETVCIKKILQETIDSFKSNFKEKEHKLDIDLPRQPVYIHGDPTRMEQIFSNLLNNAYKFTPSKGWIKVSLRKQKNNIVVKIADSGIGIPAEYLDKIFDPFEQFGEEDSFGTGLGIGLALVKEYVKLHGGTTKVESEGKNKGAVFTITFPLPEHIVKPSSPKQKKKVDLKEKLRVLIIDDNKDAVRGLKSMLQKEKCHVNVAYTGNAALKKIKKFDPEAFIVDIGLPDMDGYELLKKIKNNHDHKGLYVAITGYGHKEARDRSKKAGFDYHLNKPANFNELLKILSTVNTSG